MKAIIDLTPDEFKPYHSLTVTYGDRLQCVETFTLTRIGRMNYAVSVEHGFAYTRPQLIAKYGKVAAGYDAPKLL